MIIEIIVLLGFLGSIIGFIFFVKHYFKSWKAKSDNKKMLLAIESAEDDDARYDKFYHNILSDIDWGKIVMVSFVIGITIFLFWTFASSNKETSIGNQGVKEQVPATPSISVNDSSNMSMADFVPGFFKDSKGGLSFWFFILAGGLMFWIMSRFLRSHSF